MGHNMNPNVIRGPSQRFSSTRRVHWRWNTWVQSSWRRNKELNIKWEEIEGKLFHQLVKLIVRATCTAGAAESASVKQIIHMSSASCFRQPVFLSQPCRHGRQLSSFLTPPQGCPQGWVLLQASLAYSWGRQHEKLVRPRSHSKIYTLLHNSTLLNMCLGYVHV